MDIYGHIVYISSFGKQSKMGWGFDYDFDTKLRDIRIVCNSGALIEEDDTDINTLLENMK